ncbi:hypothetical protein [Salinisphaera aquimarina]|uniref:Cation/multidrug efflux pump n=1 Tax=Salinisphaera aquimarina TaxID=2094031 RepID=A0ABV7EWT5_9GAMM
MSITTIVFLLIAALGVALLVRAMARLRRRRLLAAGRSGMGGCLCLALAALALAIVANLHTYQRLSHEQPVAQLQFTRLGPQHYRAMLTSADQRLRIVDLEGDQWQLDARVLKWRAFANLLGFDALYRLDRLSGRYADVADTNSRPGRAAALHAEDPWINAYALANRLPRWAGLIDAEYGSASYLPMADGAAFEVALTQSGLVARPVNDAARKAVRRW